MNGISVGELVKQAKGEDRSLREYARDSGVDAAILSKNLPFALCEGRACAGHCPEWRSGGEVRAGRG